ncbi:hypothetical protein HFO02_09310 [Rhizobium laguerreae]|uniref:hypothetical protein n=1 Tax=Rhizobium laguerreae TaxID=1076926 RepID=UPI001C8FBBB5|nr:hypothetical protein [Rhizobium laguerreae]MBY3323806.1 hypothetical protein [Rhizobium laguerreae]
MSLSDITQELALAASLPVAVYSAVAIFLIKEILEWRRRSKADRVKMRVMKSVLSHECERNNWFLKSLRSIAADFAYDQSPYIVQTGSSGRQSYEFHDGAELRSGGSIPSLHLNAFEKFAVEAAYVDGEFAELVREALDSLLEAQHLRNSLIEYSGDEMMQDGFFPYAVGELDRINAALSKLYMACSGAELKDHRLR